MELRKLTLNYCAFNTRILLTISQACFINESKNGIAEVLSFTLKTISKSNCFLVGMFVARINQIAWLL